MLKFTVLEGWTHFPELGRAHDSKRAMRVPAVRTAGLRTRWAGEPQRQQRCDRAFAPQVRHLPRSFISHLASISERCTLHELHLPIKKFCPFIQ